MKILLSLLISITAAGEIMGSSLESTKDFFQKLSVSNINLVDQFYADDIVFQDPVHQLTGSKAVKAYYENLYSNVESIRFEFGKSLESGSLVSLEWRMFLKTPAFADGKEITVDGMSVIKFNAAGKAIEHRDYFDMGEFVYERISVLGSIIRYIKKRMAGNS